jgi:hypothetical protein
MREKRDPKFWVRRSKTLEPSSVSPVPVRLSLRTQNLFTPPCPSRLSYPPLILDPRTQNFFAILNLKIIRPSC